MNMPVVGLYGVPVVEASGAEWADRLDVQSDPVAAVAAHRAMNSLAYVAGALNALQQGSALSPAEREELLSRAKTHTGVISALLYDLVLGLPLGASAVADHDPLRQAEQRFGVRAGS